jgi:putative hydrolase of the HAD superfamily
MQRKAIMMDVDGVLIVHPNASGWGVNLKQDLGISPEFLQKAFFKPHWDDVAHGRAALRERLMPVLAEIAPSVTCDTLIEYWFNNDAHLDHRLLCEIEVLRSQGLEMYLATVQEHERAKFLWERLDFQSKFDGIYYAAALGCLKPATAFYRCIEDKTGLVPDEIFFIDDKLENVASARDCGWTAALWTGENTLRSLIAEQRWNVG